MHGVNPIGIHLLGRVRLLASYTGIIVLCATLVACQGRQILPGSLETAACRWLATVATWRDDNRDGQRQRGEHALEGVTITVEGAPAIAVSVVTDQRGFAPIALDLRECTDADFTIRAVTPAGFRATTPLQAPVHYDLPDGITLIHDMRIEQQASRDPLPVGFGFAQD